MPYAAAVNLSQQHVHSVPIVPQRADRKPLTPITGQVQNRRDEIAVTEMTRQEDVEAFACLRKSLEHVLCLGNAGTIIRLIPPAAPMDLLVIQTDPGVLRYRVGCEDWAKDVQVDLV